MSEFSSWLDSAIKGKGWQPADLARALDVNPSLVSKWMAGSDKPSRRMTTKLCLIFRVSADYLLPIIDYRDVIDQTDPQEQNEKRAELLARLPALARLLEAIMTLPLEKQLTYVELMISLLPGLDQKSPGAK